MDEALEQAGVDPFGTPVDTIPEHGLCAICEYIAEQNGESYE